MKETVLVEFTEQAKAIVANTRIIQESDSVQINEQEVLERAKKLFSQAQEYAKNKTLTTKV